MSKYILAVIVFSFFILQLHGQDKKAGFSPFQIPVADQDDIWSVDFATTFWLDKANSPKPNNFSFSTGLTYHYEFNFSEAKRFSIALGIGYNYTSLNHGGIFSNDSLRNTVWNSSLPTDDLKYSRLNLHRINLPLEFRVKTKSEVKVYFGYQSSFIIASKNKSKINGNEASFSNFSSLAKFQHGPRIRVGYKDVFIFSNFYVSSLFKNSSQTSMQLVEVGISLGG